MSLQTLRDRVTLNGSLISAVLLLGVGVKTPPPPATGGATDAELGAVESDLATQGALLQKAIDDAKAGNGGATGDPVPPPIPKVVAINSLTPQGAAAGSTVSVTIKGTGLTGAAVVGTGGLSFANAKVVDDETVTVDVTVAAGTPPGNQSLGVQVAGADFEVPFQTT